VLAVSPSGGDATCARGDRGKPCQTLGRAYELAQPGDAVDVACGTYPSQTIARNGRNGAVAIRAVTAHCATVNGWITLGLNNGGEPGNAPDYLTIDGIDVVDGSLVGFWNGGGPSRGLTLRNMKITDISNGTDLIALGSWDGLTIENVELGPACCQAVGLAVGRGNFGDPLNRNINISGLDIHDLSDTCATIGGSCSGVGFGSGCGGCRHIDGIQVTDAHDIAIRNTRVERLSGASGQGIFFAPANGGTFSNILLEGNNVGNLPQDDISISGPGNGIVSGYVRIINNTSAGNIILYGNAPNNQIVAPGTEVVFSGNNGDLGTSNEANPCMLVLSNGSLFRPTWTGNRNTARNCDG
jgi:hypothetical protein